jgi:hypothetical protein
MLKMKFSAMLAQPVPVAGRLEVPRRHLRLEHHTLLLRLRLEARDRRVHQLERVHRLEGQPHLARFELRRDK